MEKMIALFVSLSVCACGVPEPENTGPPQQAPVTSPADAGVPPGTVLVNTTEFCSVKLLWNYTDQEVTFTNKADRTAYVTVYKTLDDTVIVDNILAPDGEDSEDASFAPGEEVKVAVKFLDLNLSLDQFKKCGERTYVLGQ